MHPHSIHTVWLLPELRLPMNTTCQRDPSVIYATCIHFRLILKGSMNLKFSPVWTVDKFGLLSAYPNPGEAVLPSFLPVVFLVSYNSIYTLIRSFSLPGNSWGAWQLGIHTWVLTSCQSVATLCRCMPIPYKMEHRYHLQGNNCACVSLSVLLTRSFSQVQVDKIHGSLPYSCLQWLAWRHTNDANEWYNINIRVNSNLLKRCILYLEC